MIKKIVMTLAFLVCFNSVCIASVQIGGIRLVYDAAKNQASVPISNPDDKAYLIQSWVTESMESKKPVDQFFITTPPLFRLEPHTDNSVRVVYSGGSLPQDRESVFWLNIKTIPSTAKTDENILIIAVKTQIKLFYRPVGLSGSALLAPNELKFKRKDGKLVIENPTPYSVSFKSLAVNNVAINELTMVLPFSSLPVNKSVSAGMKVAYEAINDYGGITAELQSVVTN